MAKASENPKKSTDAIGDNRVREVEALTHKVFGQKPRRVAFPGGTHRAAFIADIGGDLFVLAKRESVEDAQLEAIVLKCLSKTRHVPDFIARQERWLVQQCVPGQRLPILLDEAETGAPRRELLGDALEALAIIHEAAHDEGLQHRVPRVGIRPGWIEDRIGEMHRTSRILEIGEAKIDQTAIYKMLDVKHRDFIKWDARPGNALVHEGRHYWFDWEDCGRRNALDDLACLFCDEWSMITAQAEDELTERFLPRFARSMPSDRAYDYLMVAGLVQTTYRLRLAVKYHHRDNEWWSRSKCLKGDKVGVTAQEVGRLCERGIRWASRHEMLTPYIEWLQRVADVLEVNLSADVNKHKDAA
ncbi:MAG: hypothetical protein ACR2PF_06535 [Rhizobiaceae bacterium]